jgi:hypothetical protein
VARTSRCRCVEDAVLGHDLTIVRRVGGWLGRCWLPASASSCSIGIAARLRFGAASGLVSLVEECLPYECQGSYETESMPTGWETGFVLAFPNAAFLRVPRYLIADGCGHRRPWQPPDGQVTARVRSATASHLDAGASVSYFRRTPSSPRLTG